MAVVLAACPEATAVGMDFSSEMVGRARARFDGDERVEIVEGDLDRPLPALGTFDVVVSSFAIHHVVDERKRALFGEVWELLEAGGAFLNLEHVASPTERLHLEFLAALDIAPEDDDPSNELAAVGDQLAWLRAAGFEDVDCHWKWRELALLAGVKGSATG